MKATGIAALGTLALGGVDLLGGNTAHATAANRWYDVKADYGAAGNGTTDDTTAIQNAINAAGTAGGTNAFAVVYLPGGEYKISTLSIPYHNVVLKGDSSSRTIITMTSTTGFGVTFGNGTTRYYHNGIHDIQFRHSTAPTAGGFLRFLQVGQFICSNIVCASMYSTPVRSGWVGITFDYASQFFVISNVQVSGMLSHGLQFKNDSLDAYVVNCAGYYNNRGFVFDNTGVSKYIFMDNCIGDTSSRENILLDNVNVVHMTNCWGSTQKSTSVNTWALGCYVTANANDVSIVNCSFLNNNSAGSAGIYIASGTNGLIVTGNVCYDNQTPKKQAYGLVLSGTLTNVIAKDNLLSGNLTANLSNTATITGSAISDNL